MQERNPVEQGRVQRYQMYEDSWAVPEPLHPVLKQQRRFIEEHAMIDIAESRMSAAFNAGSDPALRR